MNCTETPNLFRELTVYVNSILGSHFNDIITSSQGKKINYLTSEDVLEIELDEATLTCLFDEKVCKNAILFGEEEFFEKYINFCNNHLSKSQLCRNTWFYYDSLITAYEDNDIPVIAFNIRNSISGKECSEKQE